MVDGRPFGAATVVSMEGEPSAGATAARSHLPTRPSSRLAPLVVAAVALAAIGSRLATTISYVEDIDSLHFALSMLEFDVTAMQPHFPGYVVFVALARAASAAAGSFAAGFALTGGLATALLVWRLPALAGYRLLSMQSTLVAALVLGNGMLWLYGNRYMPDLLGVALLVWSVADLLDARGPRRVRGAFVAALLAGTRLSYLPLLAPFALVALTWRSHRVAALGAFAAGVALWAAPLLALTGWEETIAIATTQTAGHFDEFGGTVHTEPDLGLRLERIASGLWSDALGGWLPGRAGLTAILGALMTLALAASMWRARSALADRRTLLVVAGLVSYLLWIFLYQNVIYHSRHLLPFVPFLLLAVAAGIREILRRDRRIGAVLAVALVTVQFGVGASLAWQHRQPTALAQVGRRLAAATPPITVVSTGLVNDYLVGTGLRARFLAVDRDAVADSLRARVGGTVLSVGDYRREVGLPVAGLERFYHNPHVNRIWPMIELYQYAAPSTAGGAR